MEALTWAAIAVCITQSGMLSGLNLAYFSVSKLRLETSVKKRDPHALRVQKLREDANFLLSSILWANVGVNVLLALLSNSVMTGLTAFFFSTFVITCIGEIIPQAYFSRHALRFGSLFSPVMKFYQILLFPLAKPSAWVLDRWIGKESIIYFRERDVRELLKIHAAARESDIGSVEGKGAVNFLDLDDIPVSREGELLHPESIISLPFSGGRPVFPEISGNVEEPFLKEVQKSQMKWVILTDEQQVPRLALNADKLLRSALWGKKPCRPIESCHRPIILENDSARLGPVISRLKVHPEHPEDDVIDDDIILIWGTEKRIITGSDVLGRLLRGIARRVDA